MQNRLAHTHVTAVLDPGKELAGCAIFAGTRLIKCCLIRGSDPLDVGAKAAQYFGAVDTLVTEGQQVYGGPKRGNPNDLFPLTFCAGVVHGLVYAHERVVVLPRVWTKGTPKEIRCARTEAELDAAEKVLLDRIKPQSLKHNVTDAIGLGRWYLRSKGYL